MPLRHRKNDFLCERQFHMYKEFRKRMYDSSLCLRGHSWKAEFGNEIYYKVVFQHADTSIVLISRARLICFPVCPGPHIFSSGLGQRRKLGAPALASATCSVLGLNFQHYIHMRIALSEVALLQSVGDSPPRRSRTADPRAFFWVLHRDVSGAQQGTNWSVVRVRFNVFDFDASLPVLVAGEAGDWRW